MRERMPIKRFLRSISVIVAVLGLLTLTLGPAMAKNSISAQHSVHLAQTGTRVGGNAATLHVATNSVDENDDDQGEVDENDDDQGEVDENDDDQGEVDENDDDEGADEDSGDDTDEADDGDSGDDDESDGDDSDDSDDGGDD